MPDWLLWFFALWGMMNVVLFLFQIIVKVIRDTVKKQIQRERRNSMGKRW